MNKRQTHGGKGDTNRSDLKKFSSGYDQIDWSKKAWEAEDRTQEESTSTTDRSSQ